MDDPEPDKGGDAGKAEAPNAEMVYQKAMRKHVMGKRMMAPKSKKDDYSFHHWWSDIRRSMTTVAPKTMIRRVRAELRGLRTSLPVYRGSTILLRADKARPYIMQALIFAPEDTPYDSGAFLFDVFCPPEYPKVCVQPPRVQCKGQAAH